MFSSRRSPFYIVIVIFALSQSAAAFSFDTGNLILYEDATEVQNPLRSSYFGYSVALWSPQSKHLNESCIFIGAPRANSTGYPNVAEPGTVFKCEIGKRCKEWIFKHGTFKPGKGTWLGGSLMTEDRSDANVVVCGPRWLDEINAINQAVFKMKGICYERAAKENSFTQHQHILAANESRTYYDEFGVSIHIPDQTERKVVIGSPGWKWGMGILTEILHENGKIRIMYPMELDMQGYSAYAGYAVTSGFYFNRGKRIFLTGAPRNAELRGSVLSYKSSHITSIGSGEQAGEYYGYALASCDVNGDKTDELIVGAPQWTRHEGIDEGRVYVLKGSLDRTFEVLKRLEGKTPLGRFGSTITCLGDVDFDGYEDVAIGAPYAGNGKVFIYRGSRTGLLSEYSQKISAPENTRGFGFSISEPRDVDHNGYADIAVGAYLSGHVALIRSKRVVTTKVTLTSDTRQITLQSNRPNFTIRVCSSYVGKYVEKELSVQNELAVDEVYRRAEVVIGTENKPRHIFVHTLRNSIQNCTEFVINVTKNDNSHQAIKLSVTQTFNENTKSGILRIGKHGILGEDLFCRDCVVTDPLRSTFRADYDVTLAAKCGRDGHTCRSKLGIGLKTVDQFVIGSPSALTLNVDVNNTGEPAYHAKAMIRIPISITVVDSTGCTYRTATDNFTEITCQIANPLGTNAMETRSIYLDLSRIPRDTKSLNFTAEATTESDDISGRANATHSIECKVEIDVGISRKSTMDTIGFARTDLVENLPNKSFEHTYLVRNYGRTVITKIVLAVSVPTHWIHDDEKIEVVRISEVHGKLDRNQLICENATENEATTPASSSVDATTITEWLNEESPSTTTKFSVIEGKVFSSYPDNRTIYVNSTNPSFKSTTINCELAPFQSTQSVAEVTFSFELMLSKFPPEVIQAKDIIFFVTNGSIAISSPNVIDRQTTNNASDAMMIGTVLTGTQIEHHVALWILALAVFLALLLLILIIFGLFKFGFFKRSKKMELKALLQEQTDESTGTSGPANNAMGQSPATQ
ncbi:integrin alpha-PS5-like [Diprion similis]|uniref:integrin alpha-PS5-like n=1 Tax=Diprion similis TaxID=362088 RepID=UPI001EF83F7F|nr:integrin alpha-PS5-like [Diprion similis]